MSAPFWLHAPFCDAATGCEIVCSWPHQTDATAPAMSASVTHVSGPDLKILERAKGFEPSTPTLARSCSTPELHPHPRRWRRWVRRQRAELCQKRLMNATTVEGWNLRLARTACQRLGNAPKKPEIELATAVRPRSPTRPGKPAERLKFRPQPPLRRRQVPNHSGRARTGRTRQDIRRGIP
jgi:hypothetical protein